MIYHCAGARNEVAEIIAKIAVYSCQERLVGINSVVAERHVAQQKITQSVRTVSFDNLERIGKFVAYRIGFTLGKLIAADEQPTVPVNAFWQFKPQRHKNRGPYNRVETDDLLTRHMHVGRPESFEIFVVFRAVTEGGQVVRKRVDPDVNGMFFVKRYRYTPFYARSRNAQIRKTGL